MANYFNTTGATNPQLSLFVSRATKQKDRIYEFLKARPHHWCTPEALRLLVFGENTRTPITSVRRAINTLYKAGKIKKSEKPNAYGDYDHLVHTWAYTGDCR